MDSYVKSVKEGLLKSRNFFGNKNKQKREVWVLREFLEYLEPNFNASLIRESEKEPIDAYYDECGFQIKEVLNEGRRRGQEFKDKLESITEKTDPEEFVEEYTPIHITLNCRLERVARDLARHRIEKYKNATNHINVLVYLNLSDTTYTAEDVNSSSITHELNLWKSVSIVTNNCAIVLSCLDRNNQILYPKVGKLHVKN